MTALLIAAVLAGGGARPDVRSFTVGMPQGALLEFRGAIAIRPPNDAFGGLSGMTRDAADILAVSDRAHWARISLTFDKGRLTGASAIETAPLLDASGDPAHGSGWDAEGLARAPDGGLFVSFEGDHRLQHYVSDKSAAGPEIRRPDWERFSGNSGLEALAVDDAGRIWAIRERSGAPDRPFPVYVRDNAGAWSVRELPRDGDYLPTGADFGPDGALWIVERDFSLLGGFATRIRRVRWSDAAAPTEIATMATFPSGAGLDNLEAISVWRDGAETRILVLSDDNFAFIQRNVIAMFALGSP